MQTHLEELAELERGPPHSSLARPAPIPATFTPVHCSSHCRVAANTLDNHHNIQISLFQFIAAWVHSKLITAASFRLEQGESGIQSYIVTASSPLHVDTNQFLVASQQGPGIENSPSTPPFGEKGGGARVFTPPGKRKIQD
ncbi:hypothetical protein H6P81_018107 [Aristolochia fimbriata]|uniref:Uncharacterized protein n=1 Tax=Aristolochia fimbriata TaxID=158543 RepID=A0AAV7E0I9_ARIFI|nr:hypothetical protein H6P81_018107 [Aristolochia fimbriata]